jgi:hypothetical protein
MKRKYIMFGLSFLASICLALASYLWAIQIDTPEERLAYSVKQSEIAFHQYFNADYDAAKETILTHLKLLEKFSAESENPDRNPFAVDAAFWYVRLAMLEEKNNHNEDKAIYMEEAVSRYAKIFKTNCNAEYLWQHVGSMNDNVLKMISANDKKTK